MDIQFTLNNYFKMGYESQPFTMRSKREEIFFTQYLSCGRSTFDFRTECGLAAHQIAGVAAATSKPISIVYEGNPWSFSLMEIFRAAQIPFTVAILRLHEDKNIQFVSQAVHHCEEMGITYKLLNLNLNQIFDSSSFIKIGLAFGCQYLTQALVIAQCAELVKEGFFPVYGQGIPLIEKRKGAWILADREFHFSLFRFCIKNNISAVPSFFRWSPEIFYSVFNDSFAKTLFADSASSVTKFSQIERGYLSQHFNLKDEKFFTGYEKIRDYSTKYEQLFAQQSLYPKQEIVTECLSLLDQMKFIDKTRIADQKKAG